MLSNSKLRGVAPGIVIFRKIFIKSRYFSGIFRIGLVDYGNGGNGGNGGNEIPYFNSLLRVEL